MDIEVSLKILENKKIVSEQISLNLMNKLKKSIGVF